MVGYYRPTEISIAGEVNELCFIRSCMVGCDLWYRILSEASLEKAVTSGHWVNGVLLLVHRNVS